MVKDKKSNRMSKKIVIVLLLLGAGIASQAQTFNPYDRHGLLRRGHVITVHSVNLSGGLYSPEMDYWNDYYLPFAGSDDEFGSSMVYGGNITFGISSEYRIRLGLSYWSDKVKGDGAGFDELEVAFTRFSVGALYAPEFFSFGGFQIYGGVEAYVYDINNELSLSSETGSEEQNGHDYSFAPVVGLESLVGDHFLIGAELSYMLGVYNQAENIESETNRVSISGPQLTLSLGYKF